MGGSEENKAPRKNVESMSWVVGNAHELWHDVLKTKLLINF